MDITASFVESTLAHKAFERLAQRIVRRQLISQRLHVVLCSTAHRAVGGWPFRRCSVRRARGDLDGGELYTLGRQRFDETWRCLAQLCGDSAVVGVNKQGVAFQIGDMADRGERGRKRRLDMALQFDQTLRVHAEVFECRSGIDEAAQWFAHGLFLMRLSTVARTGKPKEYRLCRHFNRRAEFTIARWVLTVI